MANRKTRSGRAVRPAPAWSPAPAPPRARRSAPDASVCATSPFCGQNFAWSWLGSVEGEAGAQRQRVEIAPVTGPRIGGDGVIIGGLGAIGIAKHQIGADQLGPFLNGAAIG